MNPPFTLFNKICRIVKLKSLIVVKLLVGILFLKIEKIGNGIDFIAKIFNNLREPGDS